MFSTSKRRTRLLLLIGTIVALWVSASIGLRGFLTTHVRGGGSEHDFSFDVSPSGQTLVFTGRGQGQKDIYLLKLKTSAVTRLTNTPDYESEPSFSPDGKWIVYAAGTSGDRADHLFIRSLDGTKIRQITAEDFNDAEPSFSPDGSSIVFVRNLKFNWGGLSTSWGSDGAIHIIKTDGTGLRRLTHDDLSPAAPKFSPDGKTIVYWASTQDSKWDIYSIPSTPQGASQPHALTQDGYNREVDSSPKGQLLAFVSDPQGLGYAGVFDLFVMNADGTSKRRLTTKVAASRPVFSPDGKHIYFSGYNGEDYGLLRIGIKDENWQQIASDRLFENPMSFALQP